MYLASYSMYESDIMVSLYISYHVVTQKGKVWLLLFLYLYENNTTYVANILYVCNSYVSTSYYVCTYASTYIKCTVYISNSNAHPAAIVQNYYIVHFTVTDS